MQQATGQQEEDRIGQAVAAVLANPRVEDAARQLGVSRSTLWRMAQEPTFQARLREERSRLAEAVLVSLQASTLDAVAVLREVAQDKGAPPSARVAAAAKIVELGLKAKKEGETEARIVALELALKMRGEGKKRDESAKAVHKP